MNAALPTGTRRYITMITEMTIHSIAAGKPVRDCIASAIETAMTDQAMICDMAGRTIAADASKAIQSWYADTGGKMIRTVRPAVGVGDEVPCIGRLDLPIRLLSFSDMPFEDEEGEIDG